MAGVGCGWITPIISYYKDSGGEFSLTDENCSWIASLHFVGRGLGCLVAAITVDRTGRSSLFVLNAVLYLVVWAGVALTRRVLIHYAIRFVFGLAVGIYDTTAPIYVGENSSPSLRGFFGNTLCLTFFAGELLVFALVTYASYMTVALIVIAFAVLTLVSSLLLREPAQYLIMSGHESKAERRFTWLRGTAERAKDEFDDLKVKLADVRVQFSAKMFLCRGVRIASVLNLLIFVGGFPAINTLLTFILTPTADWSVNQLTILFGLAQLVGVTLSTVAVERFGRRTLWMVSAVLCMAAHSTAAALHYFFDHEGHRHQFFAWTIFAAITTYTTVFAALLLPLATTARGELMPPQFKAAGVCTSILLSSVTGFFVCKMFLIVVDTCGIMMNYVFYTLVSFITLLYVYFYLPETRGLTLMEIQKILDQ